MIEIVEKVINGAKFVVLFKTLVLNILLYKYNKSIPKMRSKKTDLDADINDCTSRIVTIKTNLVYLIFIAI